MRLQRTYIEASPDRKGWVRLVGEIQYDRGEPRFEKYWYEFPEEYAGFLSTTGNPWLVLLLPAAVTLGEPLRIDLPVDPTLRENAEELLRVWRAWYPHLRGGALELGGRESARWPEGRSTGAFFSGGVDSFFTVLSHQAKRDSSGGARLDKLITVWGLDIPLTNTEAFSNHRVRLGQAASEFGIPLIEVATNIRETRFAKADWGSLSHGCALGSVGLALEGLFRTVLIAATYTYRMLVPWGSHALTDPLMSTGSTRFVHHGAGFTRVEKTRVVAQSDVALRFLHVCWRLASEKNCSACVKCVRTMVTLDLLHAIDRSETFDRRHYRPTMASRIYFGTAREEEHYIEILNLAREEGREEIARAVERSLRVSRRARALLGIVRHLNQMPFLWRLGSLLEMLVLRSVKR